MFKKIILWSWGAILAFCAIYAPALQAEPFSSNWVKTDQSSVRLIAGQTRLGADGKAAMGLQFRMLPGWKVYWRSPGDAGVPPRINWTGSKNFKDAIVHWPLPERYSLFGLTTFVYSNDVILPIDFRAHDTNKPAVLRAKVSYLICEKVCIPYDATLSLVLPSAKVSPSATPHRVDLARYRARVPKIVNAKNPSSMAFFIKRASIITSKKDTQKTSVLEFLAANRTRFSDPLVLVEGPPSLRFGTPGVTFSKDRKTALVRVPIFAAGGNFPKAPVLTLTLGDQGNAVEQTVSPQMRRGINGDSNAETGMALLLILGIAFLGGLILNLMPCVLPVLSMKVLSVVGHGGGDASQVRRGFLATSCGIIFSFMVLAGGAIALKGAGAAVGWGTQFQEPWFLGAMMVVLGLFAANLFGLFEIRLPGFVGAIAGNDQGGGKSLTGAFATGAFATLLATPCSAPFLGTAIGFALTQGTAEIIAVFAMLGLGLATPYLMVAAWPGLATSLPRPGSWMVGLRKTLAVALILTAVWLGSILWTLISPPGHQTQAPEKIAWKAFDKVEIFNLIGAGKVVFVDVTADWCLTCKVNKALVIDRGRVGHHLGAGNVIAMRADWTRPNPEISAYLQRFGRFGIPFNVVYGPGAPSGIALPELLTEARVMDAFTRAGLKK